MPPPPPPLCAKVAVELNAVVKAKIAAITKAFLIFISSVGVQMRVLWKKRHTE
jgi:hypothetical protein